MDLLSETALRPELEAADFDVVATVESVVALLAVRASEKPRALACRPHPGLPRRLRSDPMRPQQVLVNLVGTAVKFTESGEVVVEAAPRTIAGDDVVLRFEVRDTGIGIPADRLAMIFEPFTQADSSMSRRFGGAGLGLTITRRLVEIMGGTITVESAEGRGSRFAFAARSSPPERGPPVEAVDGGCLDGVRALLVDDHPTNRLILRAMLAARGTRAAAGRPRRAGGRGAGP